MSRKKTKNSTPSHHHEPEDRCASCGSPCDIEKDVDENDHCNDCRPSPSKVAPAPHVVADAGSQSFFCKHCEAIQKFPELPISITKFNRIGRKFMKKHENCKPKTT
jgi:hypothetical protein